MPSLGQFIATRRERWEALETLLARSEGGALRSLSVDELDRLGRAYREVVSDLAVARRDFPQDDLTASLNALAARAHMRLYRAPAGTWRRLGDFFWSGFARRVRAARGHLALAAALLFVPGAWAYLAALADEGLRTVLVDPQLLSILQRGRTWTEIELELRPLAAAIILTNNIQVSLLAFAGGVLFGLGTVLVLVNNALMLGGVFGAAQHYGMGGSLLAFVGPHGYLEISSILIASAAGLVLGDSLLRPGLLRRRDALVRGARRSLEMVGGAAPVFVVAGLVEGFISPSGLATEVKHAIGLLLGVALWAQVGLAGRPLRSPAQTRPRRLRSR